ncbi:hypothetical protein HDU97_002613 [Phlyctochytrium planicorne]|nr:hypothetical protein HDU97_002613 [Phlyctochytrium planicorne]
MPPSSTQKPFRYPFTSTPTAQFSTLLRTIFDMGLVNITIFEILILCGLLEQLIVTSFRTDHSPWTPSWILGIAQPYNQYPAMFWQLLSIFVWDIGLTLLMSSPARIKNGDKIYSLEAARGLNDWAKHRALAGIVRSVLMVPIMQYPFPEGWSLMKLASVVLLAAIPAQILSTIVYPPKPFKSKMEMYVFAVMMSGFSYIGFIVHGSLNWAIFAIAAVDMSAASTIIQGVIFTTLQQISIFVVRSYLSLIIKSKKEAAWHAISTVESGGNLSKNLHLSSTTIIRHHAYKDYEEGYEISQESFLHVQSALYGQATLFLIFTGSNSFFLLMTVTNIVSQLVFKYVGNRFWKHRTMTEWKATVVDKANAEEDENSGDGGEYVDVEDAIPKEFLSGFYEKPKMRSLETGDIPRKTTHHLAEHMVHTGIVVEKAADGAVKNVIRRLEGLQFWKRRRRRHAPRTTRVKADSTLASTLHEKFTDRSSQIVAGIVGNYITIFTIFIVCIIFVAVDAIIPTTDLKRCSKGLTRLDFFWRMLETFAFTALADILLLYAGKRQGIPVFMERMMYPMSSLLAFAFMGCCQACLIMMAVRGVTFAVNPNEKPCFASVLW